MLTRDPFEILTDSAVEARRRCNEPLDLDSDPAAAAILRRVMAGTLTPLRRRRRRRRTIIGVVVVGLAAGSAVAASSWIRRTPATVRALACWNHANPNSGDHVTLGTRFGREDPIDTCARLWADPQNQAYAVTGPFVTCVADYGTAVVIPGASEQACDDADLDRFDGNIPAELLAIRDVEDDLADQLLAGICFDEPAATTAVRDALDRHGLEGWTVTLTTSSEADGTDVCAIFAFDEATSTATIGWIPKDL